MLNPHQFADAESEDVLGALTYLAGGPSRPHHRDMDDDALHQHLTEDHSFKHGSGQSALPTVEQSQRMNPHRPDFGRKQLETMHNNHHSDAKAGARQRIKIKPHSHG